MVFIHLQETEPGVVVGHGRLAFDFAMLVDGEGQFSHAKLIALRSQHLTVGILAGHGRERRQITVVSGVVLQYSLAVLALYFDQGVRQIIRTGQIRLGHAHIAVNQLIDHRCIQVDDDFFVLRAVIIADLQRIIRFVQFPALRTGQLPDVVISMREMSAEADLAILVRDRCRQQNVRVQQAVFIGDGIAVVQAEDEALAGNTGQGGMRHAILVRFRFQDLLLLDHADPGGQIVIDRNDAGIDHRGHMILCLQHHIIACAVEEIPRWGGYLCDVVMPKRQRSCFTTAFCRCGDLSGDFVCLEPERAVLADNVLNRTHLKDRTLQISLAIHRRMHRISEGILMLIEAGQHRALLLYLNPPLDRRIGDRDFLNLCRFSHGHDRETDDQEKQRHQDGRNFILCEIHPLYLISQSMKRERAADLAAALRLTSQGLPFLRSGILPP